MRSRRSAAGFTLIEVLIAIFVITIGIIAAFGLLIPSLRVAGAGVENTFAATLAQSVYEALRNGVQTRSFLINENGNNVRGFLLIHPGVLDLPANVNPPPLPAPGTPNGGTAADLVALRASDFAIFVPNQPNAGLEPRFVFPRPTTATAENAWPGTDDFLPSGTAGFGGEQVQLNVQRVYQLANAHLPLTPAQQNAGMVPEASDQYGFAVVVNRSIVPGLLAGTVWFNNGVPIPGVFPPGGPGRDTVANGLFQVEVLVYRNFDKSVTNRFHEPVPGGRFIGLLALGP